MRMAFPTQPAVGRSSPTGRTGSIVKEHGAVRGPPPQWWAAGADAVAAHRGRLRGERQLYLCGRVALRGAPGGIEGGA